MESELTAHQAAEAGRLFRLFWCVPSKPGRSTPATGMDANAQRHRPNFAVVGPSPGACLCNTVRGRPRPLRHDCEPGVTRPHCLETKGRHASTALRHPILVCGLQFPLRL